jgi:hypothetical protein
VYLNSSRWKVLKKIYEFIQIPIGTLLSDNSMAIVNANRKELNLVNSCLSRDDDAPHEYNLKVRLGLIVEDDAEDGMEENATEETTEDTDNVESDTEDTDDVESDDNAE